jgi:hypothetical protein
MSNAEGFMMYLLENLEDLIRYKCTKYSILAEEALET